MTDKISVHEAILAVMSEVGYVKKQRGAGLNYSYAGEAALIEALRPAMVEHGLYAYVANYQIVNQSDYTTAKGSVMRSSVILATVRFVHQSGDYIDVQACGEGADTGDKSLNKAMTGAYKYALRQTFCIETGDDPDKYPSEPKAAIQPAKRTAEQVTEELFDVVPDDKPALKPEAINMTLEDAENETNSNGVRYGDIETDTLSHMATALIKKMRSTPMPGAERVDKQRKLVACQMILAARNSGSTGAEGAG